MTGEADERTQIERAIAAQEKLRGVVDDAIVDLTLSSLRSRLNALTSTDQRRRQATVLFTDLQGFTALAETMDPELVSNVLNDVWSRLDHIVTSFGGWIDKHIGDAVMALWGAESSNENDPEQAVRAGLELQLAVAELNASTGRPLVMRVGICTGAVLLGEVATTREFTAMGDTVNVAVAARAPRAGERRADRARDLPTCARRLRRQPARPCHGQGQDEARSRLRRYCDPSRGRSGCRREGSRVWKRAWSVATRSSASLRDCVRRRDARRRPCAPWRSSESPASASRGCCTSSRTGSSSFRRRRTTSRHAPSRRGRTSRTACSAISSHRASRARQRSSGHGRLEAPRRIRAAPRDRRGRPRRSLVGLRSVTNRGRSPDPRIAWIRVGVHRPPRRVPAVAGERGPRAHRDRGSPLGGRGLVEPPRRPGGTPRRLRDADR